MARIVSEARNTGLSWNDIASDISVIPIRSDECMPSLGFENLSTDSLAVMRSGNDVYLVDISDGSVAMHINRSGKSEQEYLRCNCAAAVRDFILIGCGMSSRKIKIYHRETGNYAGCVDLPKDPARMLALSDNIVLVSCNILGPQTDSVEYNVLTVDLDSRCVTARHAPFVVNGDVRMSLNPEMSLGADGSLIFTPTCVDNDTTYSITACEAEPLAVFRYGEYGRRLDALQRLTYQKTSDGRIMSASMDSNDCLLCGNVRPLSGGRMIAFCEFDNNLYCGFFKNGILNRCEKIFGDMMSCEVLEGCKVGIRGTWCGNTVFQAVDAYAVSKYMDGVSEDDNPVLVRIDIE